MITEEDVKDVVSRYPNLELSILNSTLFKNHTKRLLVYVNSKAFHYGSNLLLEYDYNGEPKDGILQVNNGNQHIYSDWGYITEDSIYLVENKNMKKKVRTKEQFEKLITDSLKMIKEAEVDLHLRKISKDFYD